MLRIFQEFFLGYLQAFLPKFFRKSSRIFFLAIHHKSPPRIAQELLLRILKELLLGIHQELLKESLDRISELIPSSNFQRNTTLRIFKGASLDEGGFPGEITIRNPYRIQEDTQNHTILKKSPEGVYGGILRSYSRQVIHRWNSFSIPWFRIPFLAAFRRNLVELMEFPRRMLQWSPKKSFWIMPMITEYL